MIDTQLGDIEIFDSLHSHHLAIVDLSTGQIFDIGVKIGILKLAKGLAPDTSILQRTLVMAKRPLPQFIEVVGLGFHLLDKSVDRVDIGLRQILRQLGVAAVIGPSACQLKQAGFLIEANLGPGLGMLFKNLVENFPNKEGDYNCYRSPCVEGVLNDAPCA